MGIITGTLWIIFFSSWSKYIWTLFAVVSWIVFNYWGGPLYAVCVLISLLAIDMWYREYKRWMLSVCTINNMEER